MTEDRFGTLYVVATPIGNLEDITLRAVRVLGEVGVIAAEDTRITARLLSRYGIDTRCVSLRDQNASRAIPPLVKSLLKGTDVATVTDAGTPSVSDPGQTLVEVAVAEGIRVVPIPGPSALSAVLSVAALSGDGARFVGFLPRSGKPRKLRIRSIANDPACTVIYESPNRLKGTLKDLVDECGAERRAVVFRELTKVHEEIARGDLAQLMERFVGQVKGEVALAVAGRSYDEEEPFDEERLTEMVRAELDAGYSARDAAASLAQALGISKKEVYETVLKVLDKR